MVGRLIFLEEFGCPNWARTPLHLDSWGMSLYLEEMSIF